MKSNILFIFIIFAMCGILIYSGCSSSGVTRYGSEEKEEEEEESSSVRFTSKDDTQFPSDTSSIEYNFEEDFDETDPEEIPVDFSSVKDRLNLNGGGLSSGREVYKDRLLDEIIKYLNTPYKFGGNSTKGIDCSAFTQTIFSNAFSVILLRSAREQYTQGIEINSRENLKFGDLVFFNTRRRVRPGHVGIYIGSNLFAHASSKYGVIVSSFDQDYYAKRFMGGRRIENLF